MKILYAIVTMLCAMILSAQECNQIITGKIADFHNHQFLSHATLKLINNYNSITYNAISDEQGNFIISSVCKGNYTLSVSHIDCDTLHQKIEITKSITLNLFLEHHKYELQEVKVMANSTEKKSISQIISSSIVEEKSYQNIGKVLENSSGVSLISTGNNIQKPILHGLFGSRIIMLNNGVKQQDQQWGIEHAPTMDTQAFQSFEIIKGSNALQYSSEAISGIILANPKKLIFEDTLQLQLRSFFSTNGKGYGLAAFIEKGFSKNWSLQSHISYKRIGDFSAPDYQLTNTGANEKGFSLQIGFDNFIWNSNLYYSVLSSETAILRSAHIGNLRDLYYAINSEEPFYITDFSYDINAPKQETIHHLLKWETYKRIRSLGKIYWQYSLQYNNRKEFDVRRTAYNALPSLDLDLFTHTFDNWLDVHKHDKFDAKFGFSGSFQNNYAQTDTGIKPLIPNYNKYNFGLYATAETYLNQAKNIFVESGFRYDFYKLIAYKYYSFSTWNDNNYNDNFSDFIIEQNENQYLTKPQFTYNTFSAQLGLNYKFNKNSLKFNYGLSHRAPNPSELFSDGLHHSAALIENGNLNLEPEHSHKLLVEFSGNKEFENTVVQSFEYNLTPYFQHIKSFITEIPVGVEQTIRGAFPVWHFVQTNAQMLGFDIDFLANFQSDFQYKSQLSFVSGKDLNTNNYLPQIPPLNWKNSIQKSKIFKHLSAEISHQFIAKQTQFPDNEIEISFIESNQEVAKNINLNAPTASYHLFAAQIGYDYFIKKSTLKFLVNVENMFDKKYRNYLNRLHYFADDVGRNITFSIQWKF